MLPEQQQRIMGYFIEEAKDHLNTIEQGLLNLQSTIEDSEMVNEVFRAAHSVKGGAAMLGISSIQKTAHRLEDYFKVFREQPIKVDQKLETLFLRVFDALHELLEQLQGPFGLTEDVANGIMANVEPTFEALHNHLDELVRQQGGSIPEAEPAPTPVTVAAPPPPPATPAWMTTFQTDAPTRLREMLQCFKQPETPEYRRQLQTLCQSMRQLGEPFNLSAWCQLLNLAEQAIAHDSNAFRTLAPVLIKDLKQAQDLVLAGRADDITPSASLQDLVPVVVPEPVSEADLDALFAMADEPLSTEDFLAETAGEPEITESDLFGSEPNAAEPDVGLLAFDWQDEPEDASGSGMGEGDLLVGVGMAELNSLADLFEGESLELGATWQEEETLIEGQPDLANVLDVTEDASDFSDLLFDEEMPVTGGNAVPPVDDLVSLFGDDSLLNDDLSLTDGTKAVSDSLNIDADAVFAQLGTVDDQMGLDDLELPAATPTAPNPAAGLNELFAGLDDLELASDEPELEETAVAFTPESLPEPLVSEDFSLDLSALDAAETGDEPSEDWDALWSSAAVDPFELEAETSEPTVAAVPTATPVPEGDQWLTEVLPESPELTSEADLDELFGDSADDASGSEALQDESSDLDLAGLWDESPVSAPEELSQGDDAIAATDDFDLTFLAETGAEPETPALDADNWLDEQLDSSLAGEDLLAMSPDASDLVPEAGEATTLEDLPAIAPETEAELSASELDFDGLEGLDLSVVDLSPEAELEAELTEAGIADDQTADLAETNDALDALWGEEPAIAVDEEDTESFDLETLVTSEAPAVVETSEEPSDLDLDFLALDSDSPEAVSEEMELADLLGDSESAPDLTHDLTNDLNDDWLSEVTSESAPAEVTAADEDSLLGLDLLDDVVATSEASDLAEHPLITDESLVAAEGHGHERRSLPDFSDAMDDLFGEANTDLIGSRAAVDGLDLDAIALDEVAESEALPDLTADSPFDLPETSEDGALDDFSDFDQFLGEDISAEMTDTQPDTATDDLGLEALGLDFDLEETADPSAVNLALDPLESLDLETADEALSFETDLFPGDAIAADPAVPLTSPPIFSVEDPDFADLDALLGDDSLTPPPPTSAPAADDFADLDALLADPSPAATTSPPITDDFADLEALLGDTPTAPTTSPPTMGATPVPRTSPPMEKKSEDSEFDDLEKLLEDADKTMGGSPTVKSRTAAQPRRKAAGFGEQTMRVPVKHLDSLSNLVGELVVNRNSLEQDQERLRQFLDNLLYQVQQLSDVGQRMRDLYERSLLESSLLATRQAYHAPHSAVTTQSNHATGVQFESIELDRFTPFHTLSQEMIELIVRVRESASDIEFIVDETDQVTRNFRQVTTQLQEGLTRSRMVPFAQTGDRLPRGVRDNAIKCGKQAELIIEGRETLIDKMILEQLYDPLNHLVNNAVAHGIESPEVRQAAGKSPIGKITIRAFHQGNQTVISVSDDGAGIDAERIKAKAVEKKLITPAEAKTMTRLDVYDLLFLPGFSGAEKVTDLAGRGVGMDVVRTSLNDIRGTVSTDSTIGKGTTFTIRLPLTLSISKALCCISNRARIAFPMDGVEDMLDVPKERIQTNSEGETCILWRDMMLPFRPLADVLKYNRYLGRGSVYGGNQEEDIISIVVLRSAGNFIALQVDQVLGEQEIVIKQLEGPVPKPMGIAGATVQGDGRIMPIADVLELIDLVQGRVRREASTTLWEKNIEVPSEPVVAKAEPTVLIVDDSITVRELLSMTFNKIGYRVEQARDGQEAWEKLRSGLPCDIVFCDIEMPRMDGLELLSRIQKDGSLNHLPIAMLTSRGADRHRQMAIQLGARGYFTKPYLEEALLDAAQRMLKGEILVSNTPGVGV